MSLEDNLSSSFRPRSALHPRGQPRASPCLLILVMAPCLVLTSGRAAPGPFPKTSASIPPPPRKPKEDGTTCFVGVGIGARTRRRGCPRRLVRAPPVTAIVAGASTSLSSSPDAAEVNGEVPRPPAQPQPQPMEAPLLDLAATELSENDAWETSSLSLPHPDDDGDDGDGTTSASTMMPYVSYLVREMNKEDRAAFLDSLDVVDQEQQRRRLARAYRDEPGRQLRLLRRRSVDPLWEQIRLEALSVLGPEPEAGPQLYQGILSQPSLVDAIATVISHEIETELIPATSLQKLFLDMLTPEDDLSIHRDVTAAATRKPSYASGGTALGAVLFNVGLHAIVCYRVGHRLWEAGRTGLAYYMQSTVSARYAADIHPACQMGNGIYLNCGGGVVIGETAVVGDDVCIMQGVTLGGTGKESGDRHPKVGRGAILHDSAVVLGNIQIGAGAIVTAKSVVTKPVPPLARVSGVPAKVRSYRKWKPQAGRSTAPSNGKDDEIDGDDDLERRLRYKYMQHWEEAIPPDST